MNEREQYLVNGWFSKRWKRSLGLAHARTQSQLLRETELEGKPALHRARDYLRLKVIRWAWHYLRSRFGAKHQFLDYTGCEDDSGIYNLAATPDSDPSVPVRLSLASDWGTGTGDARDVANSIKDESPHFTVHLGDVYFVGTKKEVREHMLGGSVRWPEGSHGSFALNANHEMYSGGKGYFKYLLPALGLRDGDGRLRRSQRASFFCLKNDYWLVIGLDTGYNSVGLPVLEKFVKPSAKLHKKLLQWLREDVRIHEDRKRGVILLSHHQYYSQFESGYPKPAKQLAGLISRPVLWFWGHEHRLAIYGKYSSQKANLEAYGRCIGHGGLPIEDIGKEPMSSSRRQVGLVLYDKRRQTEIGNPGTPVGYNGYATLVFEGKNLTIEYRDVNESLVRETWSVIEGGALKGHSVVKLVEDEDLVVYGESSLDGAIGITA